MPKRKRQTSDRDDPTVEGFKHEPLTGGEHDTRLAELLPAENFNAMVEVRVFQIDLDSLHIETDKKILEYATLSYTWTGDLGQIRANGKVMHVTNNLVSALRHIRRAEASVTLWIDQICIDQSNIPERNQQVRQISEIYQRARRVYIWLGEGDERLRACRDLFEALSSIKLSAADKGFDALRGLIHKFPRKEDWAAVDYIFQFPWWSRTWIVQEAVVSNHITVVIGQWRFLWTSLSAVSSVRAQIWSSDRLIDLRKSQVTSTFVHSKSTAQFEMIDMLRQSGRDSATPVFTWRRSAHGTPIPSHGYTAFQMPALLTVLRLMRGCNATDPRDKVFAVESLQRSNYTGLKRMNFSGVNFEDLIDYNITIRATYIRVAHYVLSGKLDILSCVAEDRSCLRDNIHGLPSWVPDWSGACPEDSKSQLVAFQDKTQSAKYEVAPHTNHAHGGDETLDDPSLTVRGFKVDRIAPMTRPCADLHDAWGSEWKTFLELAPDSLAAEWTRYWKVVLGDRWSLHERLGDRSPGGIPIPPTSEAEARALQTEVLFKSTMPACHQRRLFKTARHEYIGLVPEAAKVGDLICVLFGGSSLYVLRPTGEKTGKSVPTYTFIGECYLHDMMDGQALDALDAGKFIEETFVLV